jgi:hypothetical protein
MAAADKSPARDLLFSRPRESTVREIAQADFDRDAARRALDETQEALRSGTIADAAVKAAAAFEAALIDTPQKGDAGEVVARVIATGDRREDLPAVPLEGITIRLKVGDREVAEAASDRVGLVTLSLGDITDTRYEIEVLDADCSVLLCKHGRVDGAGSTAPHLLELPRTGALKPHLERAQPFEKAIRDARDRAKLGKEVVTKALKAQEKALREYLAEKPGERPTKDAPREQPVKDAPRPPAERDRNQSPKPTRETARAAKSRKRGKTRKSSKS